MPQTITLAGEQITLCPERAMFWAAQATLLVADVHFGKAATFRARGVFVPHGTTTDNLTRLDQLIATWQPTRVVFLGDFFHAREAQVGALQEQLLSWRRQHASLDMRLVRGNHDVHAGPPNQALGIEVLDEPVKAGPFAFRHHPESVPEHYVLAGHLHPGYQLRGRAHQRARTPCFWLGQDVGVLPAFGAFTGQMAVQACPGERIFLAGPDRVHAIPETAYRD